MKLKIQQVDCQVREDIPPENETIEEDFHLDILVSMIAEINWYFRLPEECPFNRGNWILDITLLDGTLKCFKFRKEMSEERFREFLKPLLDAVKQKLN